MTNPFSMEGRNILVTGAAQGIGREVASMIVQHGGRVAAVDMNGDGLKSLQSELGDSCKTYTGSVTEQPLIDGDAVTEVMTVKAGHAEIVGDERVAPTKLIATLQAQGVLNPTPPERRAGLQRLLARVYGATGPIAGASAP